MAGVILLVLGNIFMWPWCFSCTLLVDCAMHSAWEAYGYNFFVLQCDRRDINVLQNI